MKDQFCTKEICIALKELGYKEECLAYYHIDSTVSVPTRTIGFCRDWNNHITKTRVSAPLFQQVIDWFRTEHQLVLSQIPAFDVKWTKDGDDNIPDLKYNNKFTPVVTNLTSNENFVLDSTTYEQAKIEVILRAIKLIKSEIDDAEVKKNYFVWLKEKLDNENNELLNIYQIGFNDELTGSPYAAYDIEIKQRAYNLGRLDAICGDDVTSLDMQTDEEILQHIRNNVKS